MSERRASIAASFASARASGGPRTASAAPIWCSQTLHRGQRPVLSYIARASCMRMSSATAGRASSATASLLRDEPVQLGSDERTGLGERADRIVTGLKVGVWPRPRPCGAERVNAELPHADRVQGVAGCGAGQLRAVMPRVMGWRIALSGDLTGPLDCDQGHAGGFSPGVASEDVTDAEADSQVVIPGRLTRHDAAFQRQAIPAA